MPTITLDNFNAATNEQIYAFLTHRLRTKPAEARIYGHLLMDPEANDSVIASRLELCQAYCQDPARIALEYEIYKESGFDPENYGHLAFMVNNLDVLEVLHRHSLPFTEPNIPQIMAIYEQEMRDAYRDRMIEAVIEALVIDIPQDQKDLSDRIIMKDAIRELDQLLEHYVELLKALDMNDASIREILGIDRKVKFSKTKHNSADENNPYMLRMELEKHYVTVAMAQDQKFMQYLHAQHEAQQGLLARVNKKSMFPAIPSNTIDGLPLTAHLHQFNSKLYDRDLKIHIEQKDVDERIKAITAERNEFMQQARRSAARKAPTTMRYILSDAKERINEDLDYIANYLGLTLAATQEVLNEATSKLPGAFSAYQERLDMAKEEWEAIVADAKDIYHEENKVAAGYKLIGLIWNLSQLVSDIKKSIKSNAIALGKSVLIALDKALDLMEPLQNALLRAMPDTAKKTVFGPGLKTTKRREERQKPTKY